MLKLLLYVVLLLTGSVAALVQPTYGVASVILAYLLNPAVFPGAETFRFQLVTTACFILGVAIRRPVGLPRVGIEAWILYCAWSFVALGFITALWAVISPGQTIDAMYEVFKTVFMISLMVRVVNSERVMRIVVLACILGVFHGSILFTFGVRFGYVASEFGRGIGSVFPDAQAGVLVIFVPLLIVVGTMGATKLERLLAVGTLPFALNAIVETYERTALTSIAFECVLILFLLPKRIAFRLLPVVAVGAALFVFRFAPDDYWAKMATIMNPTEESSANSRFTINAASRRMLADYPMGVGYRNYPDVSPRYLPQENLTEGKRSAHNSFYSILCETGYIGFGLWIAAFVGALYYFRRIRRTTDSFNPTLASVYSMGFEVGLYGWLSAGWFQAFHEVDPAYWCVGFAVILTRLHARELEARLDSVSMPELETKTRQADLNELSLSYRETS